MAEREPVMLNQRYELHSRLARGGMAEVYLARDQLLDRPVAVKVLFPEYATDPAFVERFRREAQAAANLNHPGIVGVYDWGSHAGTYFIVMEYVRGRSLAELLKAEGPLHPDRAADITIDIAGALYFAHRNGVVHRDVKPGNVLISPQGHVKVADFGIARAIGGGASENLTQTGSVMGTASYFSPEQAQGQAVDPRSDLYSLGVVLYEMLVGRPPFTGESPLAIAYQHVQQAPSSPTALNPSIPADLEAITLKLLAKNPANRYATAEELRSDLRRFRAGQPVHAEPILRASVGAGTAAPRQVRPADAAATAAMPATAVPQHTAIGPAIYPASPVYEPPGRNWLFLGVMFGLLGALVILLVLFAKALQNPDKTDSEATVELIDVRGAVAEDALAALKQAGFTDVTQIPTENASIEPGLVFDQDPLPGQFRRDTKIALKVSQAATTIAVEDVVGKTEGTAKTLLGSLGFTNITTRNVTSEDNSKKGLVVSQKPAGGQKLAKNAPIELTVSAGPDERVLPLVDGLPFEEAKKQLLQAGILEKNVLRIDQPSATVAKGQVIATDPEGRVSAVGIVRVLVSSGAAEAEVPNLINQTQSAAEQVVLAALFKLEVKTEDVTSEAKEGRVVSQSPKAGTKLGQGMTVTITVGVKSPSSSTSSSSTSTSSSSTSTSSSSTSTSSTTTSSTTAKP